MTYQSPTIERIGSLHQVTQTLPCIKDKTLSKDMDGTTFFGLKLPIGDCDPGGGTPPIS